MRNITKFLMLLCITFLFFSCRKDNEEDEMVFTNTVFMYCPWSVNLTASIAKNINDIQSAITVQGGTGNTRVLVFESKSGSTGTLYELIMNEGKCERTTLKEYTNCQYTSTEYIRSLFNDVASISPTTQYSMIIGCHGSGWMPASTRQLNTRAFGGSGYMTDIDQLEEAIKTSSLHHLEYLCFDDCYMANIELAYDLQTLQTIS